jgi:hypothetical protein
MDTYARRPAFHLKANVQFTIALKAAEPTVNVMKPIRVSGFPMLIVLQNSAQTSADR